MSLTISAVFNSRPAASRAVTLLRQQGIPAAQTGFQHKPGFTPYPHPIDAAQAVSSVSPAQHAISLFQTQAASPSQYFLTLSAEPSQVPGARSIIFRCGGTVLS